MSIKIKAPFFYLLLFLLPLVGCSQQGKKQAVETQEGILLASMADVGIDSVIINKIDTAILNGTYPNIHSLLIVRGNQLVYEKYWPGKDERWGQSLGIMIHGKDSLHDIRSISKSIVSACTGIAIQQGKIKTVDQKIFEFFPEYAKLDTGLKSSLTIKHLLTMSSGFAWNEEVPYDNPENSEIRMMMSPDPAEYVLRQPMDFPPGKVWKYNGGTTQLLAAVIEKTTGKKIDQFAKEYLLGPLGITTFEWAKYPGTDLLAAASGVRLRSRDLLKFGMLYYNQGKWKETQIVPAKWVNESLREHVERPEGRRKVGGYGYQFWLWQDTVKNKPTAVVACVGNGDQRIFFDKTHDLLVVITAGNYNKWNIEKGSYALMKDYIYPSLTR